MKKGHYGQYTGNARHSRKEEMIHDREMIYDAKNQIHNEDKSYRHTGKNSDKQDMIHERELIHDTKNQLHRADQDYKSSGPKSYQGASELGRKDKGGGSYENLDNSAQIRSMASKGKAYNDMIGSIGDLATSAIKASEEETSVATSVPIDAHKTARDYFGGRKTDKIDTGLVSLKKSEEMRQEVNNAEYIDITKELENVEDGFSSDIYEEDDL
tara:strand:+ start:167 stop:805 length:639 start_codon:yes stop_codon:yes gene_type:complete